MSLHTIECTELAGKVIRRCTIDKDASDGPDIRIEFADATVFSVSLKSQVLIETKHPPSHSQIALVSSEDADA